MQAVTDRNTMAYRIGGDEFVILFLHNREEQIAQVEEQIRKSVIKSGYSISSGYFIRGEGEDLTDVIKESDTRMYEEKADYYSVSVTAAP